MVADTRRGLISALLGSLSAACFLLPWKAATAHGSPELLTLVLLVSAASFNTLAGLFERPAATGLSRPLRPTLLLAAVFSVLTLLGNHSSAEAVSRISGALLAVLQRCEVILVALLGWLVLRERVHRSLWAGAALAGAGLVILNGPATEGAEDAGIAGRAFDPMGALFGLGSALCFGAMILLTRKYVAVLRPLLLNTVRLWLSVGLWFLMHQRVPSSSELTPELLLNGALAAFFGPFLSRLCAIHSAHYLPANLTAFASLATPPLTLLLSLLVFGTLPTRGELLGGAIMLVGIALPVMVSLRR